MTAPAWPEHLLTLEEFSQFLVDARHCELQEGVPIVSPTTASNQRQVAADLMVALRQQLPPGWEATGESQVVTDPGFPPSVRVPDLVIVATEAASGSMWRVAAEHVLVAIEIISPGSQVIDTVLKPVEYAQAGIPFYWVIDLGDPLSLVAYRLAGDGRYQEAPAVTRIFETSEPFSLQVDLTALSRRA